MASNFHSILIKTIAICLDMNEPLLSILLWQLVSKLRHGYTSSLRKFMDVNPLSEVSGLLLPMNGVLLLLFFVCVLYVMS